MRDYNDHLTKHAHRDVTLLPIFEAVILESKSEAVKHFGRINEILTLLAAIGSAFVFIPLKAHVFLSVF